VISNSITTFRTLLTVPLFTLLAFGGNAWIALALFLSAGLLDVIDGKVARARNETSAFGAMIDLLGDRLLTLAAVLGLVVGSESFRLPAMLGLVFIIRDLVVATLNEALPGKLKIRVSAIEKVKIATAFLGLSLLIGGEGFWRTALAQAAAAPPEWVDAGWGMLMFGVVAGNVGAIVLALAAMLTLITLVAYWRRALAAFAESSA
jgi:cardiolipin synthase (CMP-forming)